MHFEEFYQVPLVLRLNFRILPHLFASLLLITKVPFVLCLVDKAFQQVVVYKTTIF